MILSIIITTNQLLLLQYAQSKESDNNQRVVKSVCACERFSVNARLVRMGGLSVGDASIVGNKERVVGVVD